MNTIGVVLPTNNPKALFEHIIPTLYALTGLPLKFLVVLQEPCGDMEQLALMKAFRRHNFEYVIVKAPAIPRNELSMVDLRRKCMALDPTCFAYLFIDDNFEFNATVTYPDYTYTADAAYVKCIEYMLCRPTCGIITCRGSMGDRARHNGIYPSIDGLVATGRGMFIRNVPALHDEPLSIKGGGEDIILPMLVAEQGYYFAKHFNTPVKHLNITKMDHKGNHPKWELTDCWNWIRTRYEDPTWNYYDLMLPEKLMYQILNINQHVLSSPRYYLKGDVR